MAESEALLSLDDRTPLTFSLVTSRLMLISVYPDWSVTVEPETGEPFQLRLGSSLQISKSSHLRYLTGTASTFANLKFVSE